MGQFKINKGINKPVEFKGLKSQYLFYMAGGLLGLFMLFAVMYIIGVNMYFCVVFILLSAIVLMYAVFNVNKKYGEFGLMKIAARKSRPKYIINRGKFIKVLQKQS